MKRILWVPVLGVVALSFALGARGMKITINGKAVQGEVLEVGGKMYVPVSALKAGGIQAGVGSGALALNFGSTGGANQQNGVEGKTGEWLFNGVWRFQVKSFQQQGESDGAGWKVAVEIRNGTTRNGYAPGGTGWQGATLILEDGTSISARSDSPELRDTGLNQGASNAQTLYFDTDSQSKPERFILRFDRNGTQGTPMKFTVGDPSFRVSLK
jgi:hypothetical protein